MNCLEFGQRLIEVLRQPLEGIPREVCRSHALPEPLHFQPDLCSSPHKIRARVATTVTQPMNVPAPTA